MIKRFISAGVACLPALAMLVMPASAANNTVVVTPSNTKGWSTADTNAGGTVSFVSDPASPYPSGALQLTTDSTNAARAQFMHAADTSIQNVTQLSYSTRQLSGPPVADPSYQLAVDLNGSAPGGFTTLVYEPYWNGTVIPGTWQTWDVSAGRLWSSRSFSEGSCNLVAGMGGAPFYTLSDIQTNCPDAVIQGFGVNIGTYNPNYVVNTDGVVFNDTTYDFEQYVVATSKDQCKNGGYTQLADSNGNAFHNQGDCVSFVATNGHNAANLH